LERVLASMLAKKCIKFQFISKPDVYGI
jgi:hypothetical protein